MILQISRWMEFSPPTCLYGRFPRSPLDGVLSANHALLAILLAGGNPQDTPLDGVFSANHASLIFKYLMTHDPMNLLVLAEKTPSSGMN